MKHNKQISDSVDTQTKLKNKVYDAYQSGDSEAAYRIAEDSPLVVFEYCKICETERPTIKNEHECIICGQTTTDSIQSKEEGYIPGEFRISESYHKQLNQLLKEKDSLKAEVKELSDGYNMYFNKYHEAAAEVKMMKEVNEKLLAVLKEIHTSKVWSQGETIQIAAKAIEKHNTNQ